MSMNVDPNSSPVIPTKTDAPKAKVARPSSSRQKTAPPSASRLKVQAEAEKKFKSSSFSSTSLPVASRKVQQEKGKTAAKGAKPAAHQRSASVLVPQGKDDKMKRLSQIIPKAAAASIPRKSNPSISVKPRPRTGSIVVSPSVVAPRLKSATLPKGQVKEDKDRRFSEVIARSPLKASSPAKKDPTILQEKPASSPFESQVGVEPLQRTNQQIFSTTGMSKTPDIRTWKETPETEMAEPFSDATNVNIPTLPMPLDTIFSNLHLLIIEDSYKGAMPLNGIKKTDFDKLVELSANIEFNISFFKIEGTEKFKDVARTNLLDLLKTNFGRKLMLGLLKNNEPIKIIEHPEKNRLHFDKDGSKTVFLTLNPHGFTFADLPDGTRKMIPMTILRALGHELVHALLETRRAPYALLPPDLKKKWQTEHELKAIAGLTKGQLLMLTQSLREKVEVDFGELIPVFENLLNLELRISVRPDHLGVYRPQDLKVPDDVKIIPEKHFKYLKGIVTNRAVKEIIEFITANPDILKKGTPEGKFVIDDILGIAFTENDPSVLKALFKSGIQFERPINLLALAVHYAKPNTLNYLMTLPQTRGFFRECDKNGNSLLHQALMLDDSQKESRIEIIKTLTILGPFETNENGHSPLSLAIQGKNLEELRLLLGAMSDDDFNRAFELAMDMGLDNKVLAVFINNSPIAQQKLVEQGALYSCQFANDASIETVLKFVDQLYPKSLLIKDRSQENLIHKILQNDNLDVSVKAKILCFLNVRKVSMKDKNIHNASCFDLCTPDQEEANKAMAMKQGITLQ